MAQGNFRAALDVILRHEGGYADHPDDPGGATNIGITHETLAAWRGVDRVSKADVRALGRDEAAAIYEAHYWDALRCDQLPAGVDLVAFDMGVNAGVGRSARMLQEVVGVEQDGHIGPITLRAARARDAADVIRAFSDRRMRYYRSLRHWSTFGRGWSRRASETQVVALDMAAGRSRPLIVAEAQEPAAKARGAVKRSTGILAALRALIEAFMGRRTA